MSHSIVPGLTYSGGGTIYDYFYYLIRVQTVAGFIR